MLIPSYDDAPDLLQGSVPMGGDDPRNDAMFSYVTPEVRLRADQRPRTPPGDPKNPPANFHGQARRNDTHQLTTDPDARLYRKATGREAWGYLGPLLPGNRHGFIIDTAVTEASGDRRKGRGARPPRRSAVCVRRRRLQPGALAESHGATGLTREATEDWNHHNDRMTINDEGNPVPNHRFAAPC